ncbi:MAG: alpha/beta fold hydrolase [Myxococcales bacterium]|nr:alpha/beta fold hydrolase [Myxococcales bacterium]
MRQKTVHFYSEGSKLEADYYLPDDLSEGERRPGIVLCHGYSGVRSVIFPDYAEHFAAAGYPTLGFDYRGFGGSEGTKWRIIADEQLQDIKNAVTWFEARPEIDPERIGIWGTSNGGAHIVAAAAADPRVKCAVGQVGYGDGWRLLTDNFSAAEREAFVAKLAKDRLARVLNGKGETVPVATLLNSPQTSEFMGEALKAFPEMYCEISWESAEATINYKPIEVVDRIAPRALMLIAAEQDDLCKADAYREMFERAGEPKRWVSYPIRHYDIYQPDWVKRSAADALEWYREHL